MVVVSYDISNDKLRTKFAKYLSRFGHRLQYSVFEIDNSEKIVNNIVNDLKNKYEKVLLYLNFHQVVKYWGLDMQRMMRRTLL